MKAIRWSTSTLAAIMLFCTVSVFAQNMQKSGPFQGPKANKGTVTASKHDGKTVLTLSEDFVVPDTPDPHWQLVDSNGNVYLLNKLKVIPGVVDHGLFVGICGIILMGTKNGVKTFRKS